MHSIAALRLPIALMLLPVALVLFPIKGHGAIFKCIDASGSVSYSGKPCPADEKASRVKTIKHHSAEQKEPESDCKLAGKFALNTAEKMRAGASSSSIYKRYGGIGSMPRAAMSIVNYVYTFRHNLTVTPERVAELSIGRCEAGVFGATTCPEFPAGFVAEIGGCDASTIKSRYAEPPKAAALPAKPVSQAQYKQQKSSTDCKTQVLDELNALKASAAGGLPASEQAAYQAATLSLRQRFDDC